MVKIHKTQGISTLPDLSFAWTTKNALSKETNMFAPAITLKQTKRLTYGRGLKT